MTLQKRPTLTATPTASATPTETPTPTLTPAPSRDVDADADRDTRAALADAHRLGDPVADANGDRGPAPRLPPARPPRALHARQQRVDVALVIDASTTMRDDRTSAGRTKLDAAIEAARAFVDTLALPQDQAAVVAFNSDAEVVQAADRAAGGHRRGARRASPDSCASRRASTGGSRWRTRS